MKLWQRVVFAILIVLTNMLLVFIVAPTAIFGTPSPYVIAVFLGGHMVAGWLGVLIAREVVRSAKRSCSITAVTVAHVLYVTIVMSLAASTDGGLAGKLVLIAGFPLEVVVLVAATYWRSSHETRVVETSVAVGVWMFFLVLRGFSLWLFDPSGPNQIDVERYRVAGVVLLVVTTPLMIALRNAFWRDRGSASASANSASSTPRSR